MKKIILFLLLGASLLSGCGNQRHETHYQDKGKSAFANQNKNVHQSDKMPTSSSNKTAVSSPRASSSHPSSEPAGNYTVPKKIQKSANYVAQGDLKHTKQFTYDDFGTKLTLNTFKKINQTVTSRPLVYHFTQVRLIKNEAKTSKARAVVADAFNSSRISSTYYTLQIKFTVQNQSKTRVVASGLNYVRLSSNYAGTPLENMVDGSAGKKIAGNQTINTNVVILVPANLVHTLHSVTLQFAGAYDTSGNSLSKDSLATKITF
ncbi:hypothetical protein ACLJJ6_04040 [Pediococcus siamensis]|uniref:hypothetical protein n=1 Tax=Pediococcus siamensis TaxID=381829 RepID=UPI0039A1DECF